MRGQRTVLLKTMAIVTAVLLSAGVLAKQPADSDSAPYLITAGDPADPKYANAGANLRTGVGSIFIEFAGIPVGGFICTASVIDRRHVLTAAHCVTEAGDTVSRIRLILTAGLASSLIVDAESFSVHPLYPATIGALGAFAAGDVAVIRLVEDLPDEIEAYDLFTTADGGEYGRETRHYGHGRSGKGNKGATGGADFFYARTGLNRYEAELDEFFGSGILDQLLHDFDSGGRRHNAMEWWLTSAFRCAPLHPDNPPQAQDGQCTTFKDGSYPDFKGFGKFEVGIAPGDSGGPGFIDGKIAGVHSFGFTHFCEGVTNGTDFTCGLDSSYGEMAGDTRVSTYASWIEASAEGLVDMIPVPEPLPLVSLAEATALPVTLNARARFFLENTSVRTLRMPIGDAVLR